MKISACVPVIDANGACALNPVHHEYDEGSPHQCDIARRGNNCILPRYDYPVETKKTKKNRSGLQLKTEFRYCGSWVSNENENSGENM